MFSGKQLLCMKVQFQQTAFLLYNVILSISTGAKPYPPAKFRKMVRWTGGRLTDKKV